MVRQGDIKDPADILPIIRNVIHNLSISHMQYNYDFENIINVKHYPGYSKHY